MAATIEKARADDPAALKKKILDLEKNLRDAAKNIPAAVAAAATRVETKEIEVKVPVPVLDEEKLEQLRQAVNDYADNVNGKIDALIATINAGVKDLRSIDGKPLAKLLADLRKAKPVLPSGIKTLVSAKTIPATAGTLIEPTSQNRVISGIAQNSTSSERQKHAMPSKMSDSSLPEGERKILTVVAQFSDRGGATREQISLLAGYKKSTRNRYIQYLQQKEFVVLSGNGTIVATAEGFAALGDFEVLPTGAELREHWYRTLPEGESKILRAVCEVYPESMSRDAISEATGYMKSTRNRYIQYLQARLLVYATSEGVCAADDLF